MQYFIKAPCSSGGTCPKDLICLTKMYRLNKVCRFLWRHLHRLSVTDRCLGIEGIEAQHGIARHGILGAQLS